MSKDSFKGKKKKKKQHKDKRSEQNLQIFSKPGVEPGTLTRS